MRDRLLLAIAVLAWVAAPAAAQRRDERAGSIGSIGSVVRAEVDRAVGGLYQQGREEQTERLTRTVKIGADGELDLSNISGDIVVTRGSGTEATLNIVKSARARTAEDAKRILPLVEIVITERNGRAEVRTRYPNQDELRQSGLRNINVSVTFTITAPQGARLTLGSISGNVSVSDIKGDLALNSISGNVRVAGAGRITTAKSVSGAVEVTDTQIDGGLEAGSVSGSIIIRKVRARRLDIGTVSGDVVVQDAQCDRVEGHSVSGNVEFSGTLARNGRYELNSHSGDIRIAVPADVGFELDANSFSGSIRSDLPVTVRGRDATTRRSLRGVYGDGSAILDVTTFSGSVVITKR
jgi:DUF4097 and DUF4098 domain-containing protein YvlB